MCAWPAPADAARTCIKQRPIAAWSSRAIGAPSGRVAIGLRPVVVATFWGIHRERVFPGQHGLMGGVPRGPLVVVGDVVWYLSGGLDHDERLAFAMSAAGAVLKGERGAAAGGRLRQAGFAGRLWLDPASYESPADNEQLSILGDHWLQLQHELAVAEKVSPGTYVPPLDSDDLLRAIERELLWTSAAGEGRISLALHARWLTEGIDRLARALSEVRAPIAVAFAERNDPLGLAGAVEGLVTLLREVADVAVLR